MPTNTRFVWKKSQEKNKAKLQDKINTVLSEIRSSHRVGFDSHPEPGIYKD